MSDDHRDSLHSLDLEEAKAMLEDAPEQYAFMDSSPRQRMKAWALPCSLILNVLLFFLILVQLGNPCFFSSRHCKYNISGLKLMSEEHGLVPEFGLEKVTFMNDSRYATEDMFRDEKKYRQILLNWENDMPRGRGFVTIPDEGAKQLARPYHIRANPGAQGYSIASLHQFHCLYMIMMAHGNARFGRKPHGDDADEMERHTTHCFDYLRQSARCAGDAALEGESSTVSRMTDGWGNVHVCKKDRELVGWVLENRLSNFTGIH